MVKYGLILNEWHQFAWLPRWHYKIQYGQCILTIDLAEEECLHQVELRVRGVRESVAHWRVMIQLRQTQRSYIYTHQHLHFKQRAAPKVLTGAFWKEPLQGLHQHTCLRRWRGDGKSSVKEAATVYNQKHNVSLLWCEGKYQFNAKNYFCNWSVLSFF